MLKRQDKEKPIKMINMFFYYAHFFAINSTNEINKELNILIIEKNEKN